MFQIEEVGEPFDNYPVLGYLPPHCNILCAELQEIGAKLDHQQTILQNLLRQVRKESGLNQQELADRLGKPQSFISKYESGERRLDIIELRQICRCLDIDLISFVEKLEKALTNSDEGKS